MKLNKQKFFYFLLGIIILFPAFYQFGSSEIFYIQLFFIILFLIFYIFRHKEYPQNFLDQIVILYAIWIFLSFFLNGFLTFDVEKNLHRFVSLFIAFGYMTPYLISRQYFKDKNYLKEFLLGIIAVYSIFFIYLAFRYLNLGTPDLFAARIILGQRLPMIIGFVSVITLYHSFFQTKKVGFFFLIFSLCGIIIVLLSLTRSSYIQLAMSGFLIFLVIVFKNKKIFFNKQVLFISLLIFVSFLFIVSKMEGFETIKNRFTMIFDITSVKNDPSVVDRLRMWKGLLNELVQQPLRIIFGYGQLGPSYVGPSIPSVVLEQPIQLYSAHNEYLDVLIRNGIVGLLIFLSIWIMVIYKGFYPSRQLPLNIRSFFIANSIGLVGVLFYGFFQETIRYPLFGIYFWFYLGIVSANLYSKTKNNYSKEGILRNK